MPEIFNRSTGFPADAIYIGRPSKWGNPFREGRTHGTRENVIEKYRAWILTQPKLLAALDELRGKDLVCWCYPQPCHGDVLLELANGKPCTGCESGIADGPSGLCPGCQAYKEHTA